MQPKNDKVNFISTLLGHRNYTLMESVYQLTSQHSSKSSPGHNRHLCWPWQWSHLATRPQTFCSLVLYTL